MSKINYLAKTPVEHDGERFEIGDSIALDDKHAKPLLAVGAIVDPHDMDGDGEPDKPARKGKGKSAE